MRRRPPRQRRETWKQDTPYLQFIAIMQSLEGWTHNLETKVSPPKRVAEHLKRGLEEMKALSAYVEDDAWEDPGKKEKCDE